MNAYYTVKDSGLQPSSIFFSEEQAAEYLRFLIGLFAAHLLDIGVLKVISVKFLKFLQEVTIACKVVIFE